MNGSRKAITYIAMAFAVFLAAGIISAVGNAVLAVAGIFDHIGGGSAPVGTMEFTKEFQNVESLDIENDVGELQIKTGDTFRVEAYNVEKDLICDMDGSTLRIRSKTNTWFGRRYQDRLIVVYLPEGFVAEKAFIQGGAGKVTVDGLEAEKLTVESGAGLFEGSRVAARKAKVDVGVGKFVLTQANLNDLDLSCGVGKTEVSGTVTGKSKVECGVGALDMTLTGGKDDYGFDVETGLGSVNIGGDRYSDGQRTNTGASNFIEVEGGVGSVNIRFQ